MRETSSAQIREYEREIELLTERRRQKEIIHKKELVFAIQKEREENEKIWSERLRMEFLQIQPKSKPVDGIEELKTELKKEKKERARLETDNLVLMSRLKDKRKTVPPIHNCELTK